MDEKLPAWRTEVHEIFHEARRELREIIMSLDNLLLGQRDAVGLERVTLERTSLERTSLERMRQERISAAESVLPTADSAAMAPAPLETTNQSTSDFSARLDHLKRQLNQRLQERSAVGSNLNSDEEPDRPAD
jgi:hypothetical protein